VKAIGESQLERRAAEEFPGIRADLAHQRERLAVGANQDVLAVIEVRAVDGDSPRAPAEISRRFEYADGNAGVGK
jgi:hypothetical protein